MCGGVGSIILVRVWCEMKTEKQGRMGQACGKRTLKVR